MENMNNLMENIQTFQDLDIEKAETENVVEENAVSAIEEALLKTPSTLQKDIAHYKSYKKNKMTAEMFERVYENEQLIFFQENKRFMNSKEKKNLARQLEKMIDKGLLYVNEMGQIKTRKSNVSPPKKKRKKK